MSTKDKIQEVIAVFARGDKPGPRSGGRIYAQGNKNCSTDGETIYSYDEPIAVKLHDGRNTVLVLNRWRTPAVSTTDRHIYNCKAHLPGYGFRVEVVEKLREAVRERKSRHRLTATRSHGRCERTGHCVEHERDSNVSSCKGGDS